MTTQYLGDYQIIKQIGQGALGSVFLAEHRFIKKHYMLKVLPMELAEDRGFMKRFQDDVANLASLEHPHIVKIHNVSFSNGVYFLVSDCIVDEMGETINLAQYLAGHGHDLSENDIFKILNQVAQALDFAHQKKVGEKKIVHQGLKLNNILLGKTIKDEEGNQELQVALCDFGLTSIVGSGAVLTRTLKVVAESLEIQESALLKKTGEAQYENPPVDLGKLSQVQLTFLQNFDFLAPEQKRNIDSKAFDTKVDIYSFGVLAYYLLIGEYPEAIFLMPSKSAKSYQWNWDFLIEQCLQKDPKNRPSCLLEVLEKVKMSLPKDVKKTEEVVDSLVVDELIKEEEKIEDFGAKHSLFKKERSKKEFVSYKQGFESPEVLELRAGAQAVLNAGQVEEKAMSQVLNQSISQSNESTSQSEVRVGSQLSNQPGHEFESQVLNRSLNQPENKAATFVKAPAKQPAFKSVSGVLSSPSSNVDYSYSTSSTPTASIAPAVYGNARLKPTFNQPQLKRPIVDHNPASSLNVDPYVKQYQPKNKNKTNDIQPLSTEMVVIPGGEFLRGSRDGNRDEMPQHRVYLEGFSIDIHPVSNEQFVLFLEAMEGVKDSHNFDILKLKESRIKRFSGKFSIESGYSKHPVVGVTWYGAVAYSKWLGKRLPTEAEWEIAAMAGEEGRRFSTGSDIEKTQANFFTSDTTPVMSYPPNEVGLYDITGNIYEWCQDWYGYNYYETSQQEPDQPKGPLQGVYRVLRGGCWKSLKDDLRCSRRHRNNPGEANKTYGFRCVASVE